MTILPGTDLEVFPIALGGNTFGWTSGRDESFAVLDAFVAGGGTLVDTADAYSHWAPGNSGGESETILGEWLRERRCRDDVLVATKVGKLSGLTGLAPETVTRACEGSLRRLGVDVIDLYYAHADDPDRPVEELAATFGELVRAGKIRAIGLSNFTADRAAAWLDAAQAVGLPAPVALQPEYSLVARAAYEAADGPLAAARGLATFAYYSLASGFLTGKYAGPQDTAGAARGGAVGRYLTDEGFALLDVLRRVADGHGVAPATIALAWLLAKGVTAPIASASRAEQVAPLLAAPKTPLTADEVAALDEASRPWA